MLVGKRLEVLEHFYFCFLVACYIKRKQCRLNDDQAFRRLMNDWLTGIQYTQYFDRSLNCEVAWLKTELPQRSASEIIIMLNRIYYALIQEQSSLKRK